MIAAWVANARTPPSMVIAQGPAATIWRRRFGDLEPIGTDPDLLLGARTLISGTGWASDLEHRARQVAAKVGVQSVAVIDHWVNYEMRFERGGAQQLPDAIWVGDADAERIARRAFPDTPIEQHPNLYLAEQAREAGPVPKQGDILFLAEPARSNWGGQTPGEFQTLDFFMAKREAAGLSPKTPMRIRPHPSDPAGKYTDWIAAHELVSLDNSPDMASALHAAACVVGLNSAGLVVALEAGRRVFSALPPHAPPCVLPHRGIIRLAEL